MLKAFNIYREVPRHVLYLALAELCLQLMNSGFFLLLNYYLVDQGFDDPAIAGMRKYQYMGVLFMAFPLGLFIKGRKVKPFFVASCLLTPLFGLIVVYSIHIKLLWLMYLGMALWGISFLGMNITSMPFLIRNVPKEFHSRSIALFFQTSSASMILVGLLSFALNHSFPELFSSRNLLIIYCLLSYGGIFFISRINIVEQPSEKVGFNYLHRSYDWGLIIKTVIPTLIIAVGAGFTIPFISLFFLHVHGVQEDTFSLLGAFSYGLVALGVLYVPAVNDRYGYKVSITLIQAIAVVALVIMATTEYYSQWPFAVFIAIGFYVIRQPLMNLAGPMTTQMSMYYVGNRNQELISALNGSIWSGSWFFSAFMFGQLREMQLSYVHIFLITATLYTVGVMWYAFLIKDFERRKALGEIEV